MIPARHTARVRATLIRHVRFHGRGGEGVKLASRIASRAAFVAGRTVQDSPLYGAERRGAPVVAFVRLSDGPILERGYIEQPDFVVVMDDTLLGRRDAAVLDGLDERCVVLANSAQPADRMKAEHGIAGHVVTIDVTSIALEFLGQRLLSAPMAGVTTKAAALASWNQLEEAVRIELAEIGLSEDLIDSNLAATRQAFDRTPVVQRFGVAQQRRAPTPPPAFMLPRLPARIAAPSISAAATSEQRTTEGWRVYRPVIDRARCTRCFLCFALCPEGAIHLDAEHYPFVDYDHCKGCLVCVAECPPTAISEVREAQHGA